MSSIYDNIEKPLLPELQHYLQQAYRADFCVGYFNLRGWQEVDTYIEQFKGGEGQACRLLVGMYRLPKDELKQALAIGVEQKRIDQKQALQQQTLIAEEFRQQLTYGVPTTDSEKGLRRLRSQLISGKLQVKLFLRYPLHAKLYLIYRDDRATPIIGYVGSSNLTLSGLKHQGELNVEVVERDDTYKLKQWFEERWNDKFCLDISDQLAEIIDESWATEKLLKPYFIYLKIAYHLSQEAREGLSRYQVSKKFKLLPFQEAAVRIAAHYVSQRNGEIIGDVVGLGKTLVGIAIAYIFEEEYDTSTLIICPKNLQKMWQDYIDKYGLRAKVVSISRVTQELREIPKRFCTVLIDESHNLRNREGKRYQAIQEYIEQNGSRCILLTATPYNKSYLDLSAQLRLFLRPDTDLGIKPEAHIRRVKGEKNFPSLHNNIPVRSLLAFEQSVEPEDWQQLMSRYMVRRTRSFIKKTYAKRDDNDRYYLEFADGQRFYFPTRQPRTLKFPVGEPQTDPYARLYSEAVVDNLKSLHLPRYGLGKYVAKEPSPLPTDEERKLLGNLSRAGKRLIGFCRTNLFKRLESSGFTFLQSLKRHILRNYVYLHAIENNLDLPIGTQDVSFLELDTDEDETQLPTDEDTEESNVLPDEAASVNEKESSEHLKQSAAKIYQNYQAQYSRRFKWIRANLFNKKELQKDLQEDIQILTQILVLNQVDTWN
ncbi:MAG: phospholipase D-like domain-containing protein [Oscillatoriaceae bacterium SKW80]|nr:phospholipase D-like domain-containing protein [Oscillatoriaceae bacterium SKW80]